MKVGSYWIIKPYEAFGNRAEELYFAVLKCQREGLKLVVLKRKWDLFWRIRFRKANKELLNIKHELITEGFILDVINWLMTFVISILRIIGLAWYKMQVILGHRPDRCYLAELSDKVFGQLGLWGDVKTPFNVKNIKINWAEELQHTVGVTFGFRDTLERDFPSLKGQRYICLHVRTRGFHSGPAHYSDYRNADINHYIQAIKYLVRLGYMIVRLGDPSMPAIKLEGVIDYANSKKRSEKNDILLVEHCDCYIGSQTGPIDVAGLFEKKILTVNCLSLSHCFWYREGSLFLPKKAKIHSNIFTLKEQIDAGFFELDGTARMHDNVEYIENTSEEIAEAVREFMDSPPLEDMQLEYNAYLKKKIFEYFHTTQTWEKNEDDASQKTRWASRILDMQGSICAGYLRKNWH